MRYNKLMIFLAGLGIGGGVAYFLTKKKYKKMAEDEINDIRKYYRTKKPIKTDTTKNDFEHDSYDEAVNAIREYTTGDEERTTVSDILVQTEHPTDDERKKIYLIDDDEFAGGQLYYDQITLSYYVDDSLIINEYDNEVFDELAWLDHDILDAFANSDQKIIYMRNEDVRIDFEIVKEFGHWGD